MSFNSPFLMPGAPLGAPGRRSNVGHRGASHNGSCSLCAPSAPPSVSDRRYDTSNVASVTDEPVGCDRLTELDVGGMPAQNSEQIVRFGAFELDLRAGELRRSGIRLPVQGRPLQVLAILLRTAGQLVTGEQLRSELWPADTFVDFEHGVHNAVARVRAVLGDTADRPRFIETLPRRGYRFIGAVEAAPASGVAPKTAPDPVT